MNEERVESMHNFLHLRSKFDQEEMNANFRLKLIGGLNEEDVKKYIGAMESKFQQIEQELRREISVLTSARNKLQRELEVCKNANYEEKKILLENLEKAKNDLSASVNEINPDTAQLQNEIQQIAEERKELEKYLSDARLEIEHLKESRAGVEQENQILKSKIVDLEKESSSTIVQEDEIDKAFQDLEQQIALEKLRNEQQSKE
jgi:chromosome segregation ATPase